MSALHKYWVKEFTKFFLIIQFIIQFIFVAVDYLSRMDHFLESDITLLHAFVYVLLKVPFMVVKLTPAAVVLGVIVVFQQMNRHNELTAVKSSGISLYYLVKPAVAAGIFLSLLMIFLGETVVPVTMSEANFIKYGVIRNKRNVHTAKKDIWQKQDDKMVHFNYFNPVGKTVSGITITFMNGDFEMVRRVDAEKGRFQDGSWLFSQVLEQKLDDESNGFTVDFYGEKRLALDIRPGDLNRLAKKSEEMSLSELSRYIGKIESDGYDATHFKVDFYGKTAFPFICVIMAVIGAAIGMRPLVKERMPLGIALGIGFSFLYWVMFGFCTSLGYGRVMPPLVSAWLTNIIFICVSVIFLITVDD